MTNPTTVYPATNTAVDHTKPSKLEVIKEKAATLVDKVTGKFHHTTTATTSDPDQHLHQRQDNPVDYLNVKDPVHNHDPTHNHNSQPHHDKNPFHQHKDHHGNPLHVGAAVGDAAVPHQPTVKDAAYQQQLGTQTTGVPATGTAGAPIVGSHAQPHIQHAVPAGLTGTSHVPSYTQNIAPPAAGVVPTAHIPEQVPVQQYEYDKHGQTPLHGHDSRQYGSVIPPSDKSTTHNSTPPTHIPAQTGHQGEPITTTGATEPSHMSAAMPGQYQPTSGVPPVAVISNIDGTRRSVA
ncbi:hypothetical protein BGZ81_005379 [Podila clonocystis]|nr:hypothetical protein BGZ81_005379 [Podila clonocystis]